MIIVALTAQWMAHVIDAESFYAAVKEKYLRGTKD